MEDKKGNLWFTSGMNGVYFYDGKTFKNFTEKDGLANNAVRKEKRILKRTLLFYELRPGINITSIPELRTVTNSSIQHGLGLRVTWN